MKTAQTPCDDELYRRFLAGDIPAYDELLIRYGDNLTWYLCGYLHNLQDSEDLMIEAFARVMAKRPSIGEGSLEDMVIEPADAASMKENLYRDERSLALHRCLDRIDPELREVLWLIYFEDMSYDQAAIVMGVNKKRVDHLLTRGKQQLSKELQKEGITNAYE